MPSQFDEMLERNRQRAQEPPKVEILVSICIGCFDGNIKIPPTLNIGSGIDLFRDSKVIDDHKCSGEMHMDSKNIWHEIVLRMPEALYDRILEDPNVDIGTPQIHPDWGREPTETGDDDE